MSARQLRWSILSLSSFFILVVSIPVLGSRVGVPDPGFGSGGGVHAEVPNFIPRGARDVLVQPDGKIVVVGSSQNITVGVAPLARFNPNGSFDMSFGSGGVVIADLGPNLEDINSVALQEDGKILIAGSIQTIVVGQPGFTLDAVVARYNADGSLDHTFGSGGVVITDLPFDAIINEVIVQPDGKILTGGHSSISFLLIRYNSNGSPDTTFDGDGIAASAPVTVTLATSMVRQADGKIVLAGHTHTNLVLARYNTNGSVDTSFDLDGGVTTAIGISVDSRGAALQPDGKILVTGAARVNFPGRTELILLRLNADGSRDNGFDGDGLVVTNLPTALGSTSHFDDAGFDVQAQNDGRIVVIGSSVQNPSPVFVINRYLANGSLDLSFDGDGVAMPASGAGNCIAFQPDGKVLVGGAALIAGTFYDLSVYRFLMQANNVSDFDGDGKSDISVFRPSDGGWYLLRSQDGFLGVTFGTVTDRIVPADYDGDGKTDVAVYRPANGVWYVLNSANGTVSFHNFGIAEDLPAPADHDGDGKTDLAVFRPSTGTWYRQNSSNGAIVSTTFGTNGDRPAVGDFDGDGKADISLFRPSAGAWYRLNSSDGAFVSTAFGLPTDSIAPADYDGDSRTDVAVYRPASGSWYWLNSSNGTFVGMSFGIASDIPAPGDFDGDSKADVSVFRPADGTWYRLNSSNGAFFAQQFGANGDRPTPAAFSY